MGSKWFTGGVVAAARGRIQFNFRLNGIRYRPSIKRPSASACRSISSRTGHCGSRHHRIRSLQVPPGFNVADKRIVELLAAADLVVTADIPLAAAVIDKGGHALNPRGELYTKDNIRERLSLRNFMDELRGSGVSTGGRGALNQRERQAFANSLDAFLAKRVRR